MGEIETLGAVTLAISLWAGFLAAPAATAGDDPGVLERSATAEASIRDAAEAAADADVEALRSQTVPDRLDRVQALVEHGIELAPGVEVDQVQSHQPGTETQVEGDLVEAVLVAYERYEIPRPSASELREMEQQAQRLDPDLAAAVANLVVALADHKRVADRIDCCSTTVQEAVANVVADPARADASTAPGLSSAERLWLYDSALRIAEATDRVVTELEASQANHALSPAAQGDELFSDPFELVVVGGPGATTYTGNTLGAPLAPDASLLTVDVGGDDIYLNNAGGAQPASGGNGLAAAAAVDVGGNDVHQANTMRQTAVSQTLQGSGVFGGVGFLVNMGGHDTYRAEHVQSEPGIQRVQGAGEAGVGVLLDENGDDTYEAVAVVEEGADSDDQIVQGSGGLAGLGLLVDDGGSDSYTATTDSAETVFQAAQGAGVIAGAGALIDRASDDRYELVAESEVSEEEDIDARQFGQAGSIAGAASLVDTFGDDELTVAFVSDDPGVFWVQGASQAGTALAANVGIDIFGSDRWALSATGPVETHAHGDAEAATAVFFEFLGQDEYVGPTPAEDAAAWRQGFFVGVGVDIT